MMLVVAGLQELFLFVNRKSIVAKLIRALYFRRPKSSSGNKKSDIKQRFDKNSVLNYKGARYIKFNWINKFVVIKQAVDQFIRKLCRSRLSFSNEDKLFIHGERHVKKDLNVF